jgi:hypothetical protein
MLNTQCSMLKEKGLHLTPVFGTLFINHHSALRLSIVRNYFLESSGSGL